MMDWADDIAFGDLSGCNGEMCGHDGHKVAAALRAAERRGRVAGLREAAAITMHKADNEARCKVLERDIGAPDPLDLAAFGRGAFILGNVTKELTALADRIEKSE
jgi:hypothetical protein